MKSNTRESNTQRMKNKYGINMYNDNTQATQ